MAMMRLSARTRASSALSGFTDGSARAGWAWSRVSDKKGQRVALKVIRPDLAEDQELLVRP
ncbi:hypothetical protein STENM223S_02648 [Streptomyces tendae]